MEPVKVRELERSDLENVISLDDMSGFCLEQWVRDADENKTGGYAWGVFKNGVLAGYCSIGYADDVDDEIEEYPGKTCDSLLLSDVFIHPEYRGNGYAVQMITEAIKLRQEMESTKEHIFCQPISSDLEYLYGKCGFESIGNGNMVINKGKKHEWER